MGRFIVFVVAVVGVWYVWHEGLIGKWNAQMKAKSAPVENVKCEVHKMSCQDLVRMLNSFRSGRYYEAAGRLLDVSLEDTSMYRDNGAVIFLLSDGTKLIHNQGVSGPEKGYLTVIFPDKYVMKFDARGGLVSRG